MVPKPASKYHALKWLIELTKNNYKTKFNVEYNKWEVDQMILIKQAKKALELIKLHEKLLKNRIKGVLKTEFVSYLPVFYRYNKSITFNNSLTA